MLKKFLVSFLLALSGVAGNLLAAWIQQDVWSNLFTSIRLQATLISFLLMLFWIVLLETPQTLPWNWRWHRFWYLLDVLTNPDLKHWKKDFARLEMAQRQRKVSAAEVIVQGKRQDMVVVLYELIAKSKKKDQRAIVLGEPGSGKTTGLERLTLELAKDSLWRLNRPIPLLIRLGNFQEGKLLDYVAQTMQLGTKGRSGKLLSNGIEKMAHKGCVIFLFDALDEALGERREKVLAELDDFLRSRFYENVPIVITSRTREDPGSRLQGLKAFEIQDLNDKAVDVFVQVYKRDGHIEKKIKERLEKNRLLEAGGLGRNPFWLRLVVESGVFAGNKAQTLNEAVDALLAREWDSKSKTERSWRRILLRDEQLKATKQGLAWLGYRMSAESQVTLDWEKAQVELKNWLKPRVGFGELTPQDILWLGRDAQILVYFPGPVRFRHRLLQEFMTALTLTLDKKLLDQEFNRCAKDIGWWEILFMLAELVGKDSDKDDYAKLVLKLLEDGSKDNCIIAAIGLLCSIENPPENLSNKILSTFTISMGEELTPTQFSAAQELGRILGDTVSEIFGIIFNKPSQKARKQGAELLLSIKGKRSSEILLDAMLHEDNYELTEKILVTDKKLAVDFFIDSLSGSEDNWIRQQAVHGLKIILDPKSVELLITVLLHDRDEIVRCDAAEALGDIRDCCAVKPLINVLKDSNKKVCKCVADALGKIGDPLAVKALLSALSDQDIEMRRHILKALGKIKDTRAIEPLLALFHSFDRVLYTDIAEALANIGKASVKPLISVLNDSTKNNYIRFLAADVLGQIGDPQAVKPLVNALSELNTKDLRMRAAEALGKIGDLEAIDPLITALKDRSSNVIKKAIGALGKIGDSHAIDPLLTLLNNRNKNMHFLVVDALLEIRNRHAILSVIKILNKSELYMREYIAKALAKKDKDTEVPLIVTLCNLHKNISSDIVETLSKISNISVAEPIITSLSGAGTTASVELIGSFLQSHNSDIREQAINKLGQINNRSAMKPLVVALRDQIPKLRKKAANTILKIGEKDVVDSLIEALSDPSYKNVCRDLVKILVTIKKPHTINSLIDCLRKKDNNVRSSAIEALVMIADSYTIKSLIDILGDNNKDPYECTETILVKIDNSDVIKLIINSINDPDKDILKTKIGILLKISDPSAITSLRSFLLDPNNRIRFRVIDILLEIRNSAAITLIIESLNSSEPYICKYIAKVLSKKDSDLAEPLIESLFNSNIELRDKIDVTLANLTDKKVSTLFILALSNTGRASSVRLLSAIFRSPNSDVREDAAKALIKIGNEDVVRSLIDTFCFFNIDVRKCAIEALGNIGSPYTINSLIATLRNSNMEVRNCAKDALIKIDGRAVVDSVIATLNDSNLGVCKLAVDILINITDSYKIEALINALQNPNRNVYMFALEALWEIDRSIIPLHIKLQDDDSTDSWKSVVEALLKIDSPYKIEPFIDILCRSNLSKSVELLYTILKSQNRNIGLRAGCFLAKIGNPNAINSFIAALDDSNPEVRIDAEKSLVKIGKPAVPLLINAFSTKNKIVLYHMVKVLGEIGDSRGVKYLIYALQDSRDHEHVIKALVKIGTSGVPSLISALQNTNRFIRRGAAQSLGQIGDWHAVQPLLTLLNDLDPQVKWNVIEALEKIGDSQALPELNRVIQEDKDRTYLNASVADRAKQAYDKIRERGQKWFS